MRKQPERTARTKQALKDSFWDLYCQKPIEKITIREITDEAGVYRSTFYEYYTDAYEVLEEIEKDVMDSYQSFASHVSEIQGVPDGMKLITAFYSANAERLAVLLGPEGDASFLHRLKGEFYMIGKELFGISDDDLEVRLYIEMATSSVISLLSYWLEHRDEMSLEETIKTGSKFFRHGLLSYLQQKGLVLGL